VTARVIALDTSVIVAIALDEPEANVFKAALRNAPVLIGWPTLFETRIVLAANGFANAREIVARLAEAPNVAPVLFDREHYGAAESAFDRFGKSRHPASLNMGDCFAYAVAAVARAPLLFKGRDFGQTDLAIHPAAALTP
jgi:ribonuclease VapC